MSCWTTSSFPVCAHCATDEVSQHRCGCSLGTRVVSKILVVDDEIGILSAISELIAQHQFGVIAELNLCKALAKCGRDPPDLVLCDLLLTDTPPALVYPAIRRRLPSTPLVLMSSMAEPDVRSLVRGEYGFLQKPFTIPQMLARIEAALSPTAYLKVVDRS